MKGKREGASSQPGKANGNIIFRNAGIPATRAEGWKAELVDRDIDGCTRREELAWDLELKLVERGESLLGDVVLQRTP